MAPAEHSTGGSCTAPISSHPSALRFSFRRRRFTNIARTLPWGERAAGDNCGARTSSVAPGMSQTTSSGPGGGAGPDVAGKLAWLGQAQHGLDTRAPAQLSGLSVRGLLGRANSHAGDSSGKGMSGEATGKSSSSQERGPVRPVMVNIAPRTTSRFGQRAGALGPGPSVDLLGSHAKGLKARHDSELVSRSRQHPGVFFTDNGPRIAPHEIAAAREAAHALLSRIPGRRSSMPETSSAGTDVLHPEHGRGGSPSWQVAFLREHGRERGGSASPLARHRATGVRAGSSEALRRAPAPRGFASPLPAGSASPRARASPGAAAGGLASSGGPALRGSADARGPQAAVALGAISPMASPGGDRWRHEGWAAQTASAAGGAERHGDGRATRTLPLAARRPEVAPSPPPLSY
jgi:hypothetical protein